MTLAVAQRTKPTVSAATQIDSLTSLRFFAAVAIVALHTAVPFGVDAGNYTERMGLRQGVAFFFVLSGFILTHVYKSLDDSGSVRKFLVARVARIWPTHLLGIVAVIIALGPDVIPSDPLKTLSVLTMVNAWIPIKTWYFCLDTPAWSISTEFFFYLVFPTLLWLGRRNILLLMLAGTASLLTGFGLAYATAHHAFFIPAGLDVQGLLYINPLTRVFEFTAGIALGLALSNSSVRNFFVLQHKWLSLVAVASVLFVMIGTQLSVPEIDSPFFPFVEWMTFSGGVVPYMLLIAVASCQLGWLQRGLSNGALVRLGHISYAMYLLHYPLERLLYTNRYLFFGVPEWLLYSTYWIALLMLSDVTYSCFETPARKMLLALSKGQRDVRTVFQSFKITSINFRIVAELCAMSVLVIGGLCWEHQYKFPSQQTVSPIVADSRKLAAHFGANHRLIDTRIVHHPDGDQLELFWESLKPQRLSMMTGIHLLDSAGQITLGLDQYQDIYRRRTGSTVVWVQRAMLPAKYDKVSKIGITIYKSTKDTTSLRIAGGNTDWDGQRLLIAMTEIPRISSTARISTVH